MAMNFVYLPYDYLEEMAMLTDEEFGRLTRGMLAYAQTGDMPGLTGSERFFAVRVRNQLDRNRRHYEEKCEKARQAANARWGKTEDGDLGEAAPECGGMRQDANTNPNPNPNPSTSPKKKGKKEKNPSPEKDTQGRPTPKPTPNAEGEREAETKAAGTAGFSTGFSTDFSTGAAFSTELSTEPGTDLPCLRQKSAGASGTSQPVPPEDMQARKRFWLEQLEREGQK